MIQTTDYRTFPDIPSAIPSTTMILTGLASLALGSLISYNLGRWETDKLKNAYKKLR